MTQPLQGKVCVITGASSGIGEATARRLSEAGAAVALGARRVDRLTTLVEEIESNGGRALAVPTDVSDESQAKALVEDAANELGRLDVLVNNAGLMLLGPIEGADTGEWRRMIGVNVLGLLYCTHAALPIMREQGAGHIVNVSSVAGRVASAGVGVYNATKWAVGGFSEALRQEALHANVRVTLIEPGMVTTELASHNSNPAVVQAIEHMRSQLDPLTAEDIAESIYFAITTPEHMSINELLVRPTKQAR
jgi:NADP-dependent 3-hydroxy acid dehydrogenase YdfG